MAEPGPPRGPVVLAAGGVLWRPEAHGSGIEVAVVHRPKYDDWSLPKGKLDPGELAVAAARREVAEETGCSGTVGRTLGVSRYTVLRDGRERQKTVRWWAIRATGGQFSPSREVDQVRWLPPAQALGALTHERDVEPLRRFLDGPPETTTLLLLRHGSAGSREGWDGDDDARPLDDAGRAQAEAARLLLPLYGVRRLVSAPLERCTATLSALAADLGTPVELDAGLGADGWSEDPERTVQRLRQLLADGVPTVACSQGEVVPNAVTRLAEKSELDLGRPRAEKGSVWALSFDDAGRLLDADYTESLLA